MSRPGPEGAAQRKSLQADDRLTMSDLETRSSASSMPPATRLSKPAGQQGDAGSSAPEDAASGSQAASHRRSFKQAGKLVGLVSTSVKPKSDRRGSFKMAREKQAFTDYSQPGSKTIVTLDQAINYFGGHADAGRMYMALLDRRLDLDEGDVVSFFGGNEVMAGRLLTVAEEIRQEVGREEGVTLSDLRRLEGAWIDFSTGSGSGGEQRIARLASAQRPPSYTHQILKRAGLAYERGHPVFLTGQRKQGRQEMGIDFLRKNEHDPLTKQKYLQKPWWDSFEQETKLAGRFRSRSTEPERLSVSLPRLCGAKSSLSAQLEGSDMVMGLTAMTGARGFGSIVFDTEVDPASRIVRLPEEAREIRREVEELLSDPYRIDVRDWDIPIRVVRASAMQHAAITNKTSLQGNIPSSVRALCVKHEAKLPNMMGRHLHSREFYAGEGVDASQLPASVARAKRSIQRDVDEILLLEGLTRQVAAAELAKELGRSFLFLRDYPGLDVATEAGFCELCAYLWVRHERDKALAMEKGAIGEMEMCKKELEDAKAFMQVVQGEMEDARRERAEADDAQLKAKKQLAEATEAKLYGWPGAVRRMEAALESQMEACKEVEEALEAESKVYGIRLVQAETRMSKAGREFVRATGQVEQKRSLAAQCHLYMLAQENNPHVVYGKGFRKALRGYEAADEKMGFFLMHLKEKGRFVKLKGKSKEELAAEEEEKSKAAREREEAAENEKNKERLEGLAQVVARLASAPPGAPGPPAALSYEETPTLVHAEPAASYEEELMDDLQDRMTLVDPGAMNGTELAEYCALILRGEHNSAYCQEAGEAAFTQAKEVRATGELDQAMRNIKKAKSAFKNAGKGGEKRLWDVQSLEKAVSNEVHQLEMAVSLHRKAHAAVQTGSLLAFRRHYQDSKTLYLKCGAAAQKEGMLPSLEVLEKGVVVQETNVMRITDMLNKCLEAKAAGDYENAGHLIVLANSDKEDCGTAGIQLFEKVAKLFEAILEDLRGMSEAAEAKARAKIDQDDLDGAFVCVSESLRALRHAAVARGMVQQGASSEAVEKATRKLAVQQGSTVLSLEKEMEGTRAQFRAFEAMPFDELDSWPDHKEVAGHLAKCREVMAHLNEARRLLGEARSDHAGAKISAMQQMELQVALRLHSNDRVQLILSSGATWATAAEGKLPHTCLAVAVNNTVGLEHLMQAGADLNACDDQGDTAVHYAVKCGSVEALKKLASFKDVDPNKHNKAGRTPLIEAVSGAAEAGGAQIKRRVMRMRRPSVQVLLSNASAIQHRQPAMLGLLEFRKLDPNITALETHARTPLIIAAEVGNEAAVKALLTHPKIDANAFDARGRSALLAAIWAKVDILRLIKNSRVDVNKPTPGKGWAPLHVCVLCNNLEALNELLDHAGVDITRQDNMGWTCLHIAMREKNVKALSMLLSCSRMADDSFLICQNMRTASSLRLQGDKTGTGMWLDATPETYKELPAHLYASQQWDTLHQVLCNIAFMSGIIGCHGVDLALQLLRNVVHACQAFRGVGASIREDFQRHLAVIDAGSDKLRTHKLSFVQLAVHYHLSGVRVVKASFQQVVDEVNDIGSRPVGWGSAYFLSAGAYLQRHRILRHGGSLRLDLLLQHPVEYEVACKTALKFFGHDRLDDAALQEISQVIGVTGMGNQSDSRDFQQAAALIQVAHESRSMSEHIRVSFEAGKNHTLQKLRDTIPAALGGLTHTLQGTDGGSEPFFRVIRLVKNHAGHSCAIVRAGSDPFCLSGVIELARLRNLVDKITRAFAEKTFGTDALITLLGISRVTRATPSVFVTLELACPVRVTQFFPTEEALGGQLTADIVGCVSMKASSISVLSVGTQSTAAIVEFLSDVDAQTGADGQKAFRRNKGQAEKLVGMVRVSGSSMSKGLVTEHVLSASVTEGHLPPMMPGEWRDAHCYVVAPPSGMHSELEMLEKFFLAAVSTNLISLGCYFTWTILPSQMEDTKVPIGLPRRLAMIDRGHLPQAHDTANAQQPLCFPLVLVGGVEGRKLTPFEITHAQALWQGQAGGDVSADYLRDIESVCAAHACAVGGKEAFAMVRRPLELGEVVPESAASAMQGGGGRQSEMLAKTGGGGGSRRVCSYDARLEGYGHEAGALVKKLKALKAAALKAGELLGRAKRAEKLTSSRGDTTRSRQRLTEARLKMAEAQCLRWWRLARSEGDDVPDAVICDPFFCRIALEAGEPGITVIEQQPETARLATLEEAAHGVSSIGVSRAASAAEHDTAAALAPSSARCTSVASSRAPSAEAAEVPSAPGEEAIAPGEVGSVEGPAAAPDRQSEGQGGVKEEEAGDEGGEVHVGGVEGGATAGEGGSEALQGGSGKLLIAQDSDGSLPRSASATPAAGPTQLSSPLSSALEPAKPHRTATQQSSSSLVSSEGDASLSHAPTLTYDVTRGSIDGSGDCSREASTGVRLDVRWGMYRAALAVYDSVCCYLPTSRADAPYHQHLMERGWQAHLRALHAKNMLMEVNEPRTAVLEEVVAACLSHGFGPVSSSKSMEHEHRDSDDAGVKLFSSMGPAEAYEHGGLESPSVKSMRVASVAKVRVPIYLVHGLAKGCGRTTVLAKAGEELVKRLIQKEFEGAVITYYKLGGTFGEVVAYLRRELALQFKGAAAFGTVDTGELDVERPAVVAGQTMVLMSSTGGGARGGVSSRGIEHEEARKMLQILRKEVLDEIINEGHHLIFVLDNLDEQSQMEMMMFVISIQHSILNPGQHHDHHEGAPTESMKRIIGSITLLMPLENMVPLRKYARPGEFPADAEHEAQYIQKFELKSLSSREQKVLFQRVLQLRGILQFDLEIIGNVLEKKKEQAENPLYLVVLAVTVSSILEVRLSTPTEKALDDIVSQAPKTLHLLCTSYLVPSAASYAGLPFDAVEHALHILSVHANGIRTGSLIDSIRALVSSSTPVSETQLMMLFGIIAPLLRPRQNFSDPVAVAHPYLSMTHHDEQGSVEGLGSREGGMRIAEGAADHFITEEEREEEEIAPDIMNDMQQLRDHFLDIFIRSFVNPLISAAAPPLNSNILTELDPFDETVSYARGVEIGGPDMESPSAWKGDAALVIRRWCRVMELLCQPFPGYKPAKAPEENEELESMFERVSSAGSAGANFISGQATSKDPDENSDVCYMRSFTRLCLLENANVMMTSDAFTSPVFSALSQQLDALEKDAEAKGLCSLDARNLTQLHGRFKTCRETLELLIQGLRIRVEDLHSQLVKEGTSFWEHGVPGDVLEREFRNRVSLCLADLRSDIQRRVRAGSNIRHEGSMSRFNTDPSGLGGNAVQASMVDMSWEHEDESWATVGERAVRDQCQKLEQQLFELRPTLLMVAAGMAQIIFERNQEGVGRHLGEENYRAAVDCYDTCVRCGYVQYQEHDRSSNGGAVSAKRVLAQLKPLLANAEGNLSTFGGNSFVFGPASTSGYKCGYPTVFKIRARTTMDTNRHTGGEAGLFRVTIKADVPLSAVNDTSQLYMGGLVGLIHSPVIPNTPMLGRASSSPSDKAAASEVVAHVAGSPAVDPASGKPPRPPVGGRRQSVAATGHMMTPRLIKPPLGWIQSPRGVLQSPRGSPLPLIFGKNGTPSHRGGRANRRQSMATQAHMLALETQGDKRLFLLDAQIRKEEDTPISRPTSSCSSTHETVHPGHLEFQIDVAHRTTDNGDGTYDVAFTPTFHGIYDITVAHLQADGEPTPLRGTPFSVEFRANRPWQAVFTHKTASFPQDLPLLVGALGGVTLMISPGCDAPTVLIPRARGMGQWSSLGASWRAVECAVDDSELPEGLVYDQRILFSASNVGTERFLCLGGRVGELEAAVVGGSEFEVFTLRLGDKGKGEEGGGGGEEWEEGGEETTVIKVGGGRMWAACIPPDAMTRKETKGLALLWPWDGVPAPQPKSEEMLALEEEDVKANGGGGGAGGGGGKGGKGGGKHTAGSKGGRGVECKRVINYGMPIIRIVRTKKEDKPAEGRGRGRGPGLSVTSESSQLPADPQFSERERDEPAHDHDLLVVHYSQKRSEFICNPGYVPFTAEYGGGGVIFGGMDHRDIVLSSDPVVDMAGQQLQTFDRGMFKSVLPHHRLAPESPLVQARDRKMRKEGAHGRVTSSIRGRDISPLHQRPKLGSPTTNGRSTTSPQGRSGSPQGRSGSPQGRSGSPQGRSVSPQRMLSGGEALEGQEKERARELKTTMCHAGFSWRIHAVSGDIPPPRSSASILLRDGCVWLCGGRSEMGDVLDDLYVLDLSSHEWRCIFSFHANGDTVPWRTALHGNIIVGIQHGVAPDSTFFDSSLLEARWMDLPRALESTNIPNKCLHQAQRLAANVARYHDEVQREMKDGTIGVVKNAIYKAIVHKDVDETMDTIFELLQYAKNTGADVTSVEREAGELARRGQVLAIEAEGLKSAMLLEIRGQESSIAHNLNARLKVLQSSGWYREADVTHDQAHVALQIDAGAIEEMLRECEAATLSDKFFGYNSLAKVAAALRAEQDVLALFQRLWAIRQSFSQWAQVTLECASLRSAEPLDGIIVRAQQVMKQSDTVRLSACAVDTWEMLGRARRTRDCLVTMQIKSLRLVRGLVLEMEDKSGLFLSPPTMQQIVLGFRSKGGAKAAAGDMPDMVKCLERVTDPISYSQAIPRPTGTDTLRSSFSKDVYCIPEKWDVKLNIRLHDRSKKHTIKAVDPANCLATGAGRELKVHFAYTQEHDDRVDQSCYVWTGNFSGWTVYTCHKLRMDRPSSRGAAGEKKLFLGEAVFRVGTDQGPFHFCGAPDWTEVTLAKEGGDAPASSPARRPPAKHYSVSELRCELGALKRETDDHKAVLARAGPNSHTGSQQSLSGMSGSGKFFNVIGGHAGGRSNWRMQNMFQLKQTWQIHTNHPRTVTGRCIVVDGVDRGAALTSTWTPWQHDEMNRFVVRRPGLTYAALQLPFK